MPVHISRTICPLAFLTLALLNPAPVVADLVVEVEGATVSAGGGGTFDVLLRNTGNSDVAIAGFSFKLTSSNDITFTDVTTATASPDAYIFDGHSLFGPDIITSSPGPGTVSAADQYDTPNSGATLAAGSAVGLGHVSFSVAPDVSGTYSVDVASYADTSLSAPDGANVPIGSFAPGTITIASVPEPSSLVLVGMGILGLTQGIRTRPRHARG